MAEDVGGSGVGPVGNITTAVLLVLATVATLYSLFQFWPPGDDTVNWRGTPIRASLDYRLFVVVALSGALGGLIHVLRSLAWYVGNRTFTRSWLLWYAIVPVVGGSLGVVFYLVSRGGLLSGASASTDVNPYGFCAFAALVGLFSEQAVRKLKQVFETLLAPAEKGKDHTPAAD